jgi:hypothetical protein
VPRPLPRVLALVIAVATLLGVSAPSASAKASFPAPITKVMQALRSRTQAPLVAPTSYPYTSKQLAATATTVTANAYEVDMVTCFALHPIHDARLARCEANVDTIGSFGATSYTNTAAALAALNPGTAIFAMSACPSTAPVHMISGQAVRVCTHPYGNSDPGQASWTEGQWTAIVALYPTKSGSVGQQIKTIIAAMRKPYFSRVPGQVAAEAGGDGQHTTAEWRQGTTVYNDFDNGDAVGALKMAASSAPA